MRFSTRFLVGICVMFASPAVGRSSAQDLSHLLGARPVVMRSDRVGQVNWGFQDWFSPTSLLIWHKDPMPQGTYLRLDIDTGETAPLTAFSNAARKTDSYVGCFQLSPNKKRALGCNANGALVISLDGKLLSTSPLGTAKGDIDRTAWVDDDEWVELVFDAVSGQYTGVKFHRATGDQPARDAPLASPISPYKPGGDMHVDENRHLILEDIDQVRSGAESYIANARLYDLDLTKSPVTVHRIELKTPDPYITAMAVAPQGTRVAWGIAPKAGNWQEQILVVAAYDGTHQRRIGQAPAAINPRHVTAFPGLRWSPDGTRLIVSSRPIPWSFAAE